MGLIVPSLTTAPGTRLFTGEDTAAGLSLGSRPLTGEWQTVGPHPGYWGAKA